MEAILITNKNRLKILGKLYDGGTINIIMKKSTKEHPAYFVPNYNSDQTIAMGWTTYPQSWLEKFYRFDPEKIKTEYVEIESK